MDERAFLEYVARQPGCFVSRAYAGLSLSGYKGDKIKEALLAKGLLLQQETRQGEGGRVAKTLSLTEKGVALLTETLAALSGKGREHAQASSGHDQRAGGTVGLAGYD